MNMTTDKLTEINNILISLLGYELAKLWWTRPNRHFDGQTPLEVWQISPYRVYKYVCAQQ